MRWCAYEIRNLLRWQFFSAENQQHGVQQRPPRHQFGTGAKKFIYRSLRFERKGILQRKSRLRRTRIFDISGIQRRISSRSRLTMGNPMDYLLRQRHEKHISQIPCRKRHVDFSLWLHSDCKKQRKQNHFPKPWNHGPFKNAGNVSGNVSISFVGLGYII